LRLSENDIIDLIGRRFPGGAALTDDCGRVPAPPTSEILLATADLMESGTHFNLEWHPPKMLGRKLMAVNMSDLDASGARPLGFMLTLAVGRDVGAEALKEFLEGIAEAAHEYGAPVIGGDTVGRECGLGLGVTAFGAAVRQLHRNGVQVNDCIYVDHLPGASARGLKKLQSGQRWDPKRPDADILAHLDPRPNIGLGAKLAAIPQIHACIDVSDGLCKELLMLAEASGLSIVAGPDLGADELYGGEDYSRCFSCAMNLEELQNLAGREFHYVAKAIPKSSEPVLRYDGNNIAPLEDLSFRHMG
jgi:thiamine-monophosphate kinase